MNARNEQSDAATDRLTHRPDQGPASGPDDVASTPERTHGGREGNAAAPKEVGGPKGPEPTRFGDWERKGRCIDF